LARHLKPEAKILHPLPRNDEIPLEIDAWPQAHYFEQADNGIFVRMKLLIDTLPRR
jgi:aspartate carbamoyltransferase catalytic subunit